MSEEEILCKDATLFIGTVVDVESRDDRRPDEECCAKLFVTIRVDRPLSATGGLGTGAVVTGEAYARNGLPITIGDRQFQENEAVAGRFGFPATGRLVTTSEAQTVLDNKQFVFGRIPMEEGGYFITAWPLDRLDWVHSTMAGHPACTRRD